MLLNAFQMHSYCRSVLPSTFSQCLPNALPPPKHLSVSSKRLPNASQCLSMPVHAFQTPSSSSQCSRCFSMPSKRFPISLNVSQCFSMPSKHLPIAAQCFPALLNVSLCLPNTPPLPKHLSMSSERPHQRFPMLLAKLRGAVLILDRFRALQKRIYLFGTSTNSTECRCTPF